ncbi:MAG: hypothetical protein ACKVK5_15540, partial [Pseudomonadales bacterium]
ARNKLLGESTGVPATGLPATGIPIRNKVVWFIFARRKMVRRVLCQQAYHHQINFRFQSFQFSGTTIFCDRLVMDR